MNIITRKVGLAQRADSAKCRRRGICNRSYCVKKSARSQRPIRLVYRFVQFVHLRQQNDAKYKQKVRKVAKLCCLKTKLHLYAILLIFWRITKFSPAYLLNVVYLCVHALALSSHGVRSARLDASPFPAVSGVSTRQRIRTAAAANGTNVEVEIEQEKETAYHFRLILSRTTCIAYSPVAHTAHRKIVSASVTTQKIEKERKTKLFRDSRMWWNHSYRNSANISRSPDSSRQLSLIRTYQNCEHFIPVPRACMHIRLGDKFKTNLWQLS